MVYPYTVTREIVVPPSVIPDGRYANVVHETKEALENCRIKIALTYLSSSHENGRSLHAYIPRVRLDSGYWVRIIPRTKGVFFKIDPKYSKKNGTVYELVPPLDSGEFDEEVGWKEKIIQPNDVRTDDFSLSVISTQTSGNRHIALQESVKLIDKLQDFYSEFEMKTEKYGGEFIVTKLRGSGEGKFTLTFRGSFMRSYNRLRLDMTFPFVRERNVFEEERWEPLPVDGTRRRLELFDWLTGLFWL